MKIKIIFPLIMLAVLSSCNMFASGAFDLYDWDEGQEIDSTRNTVFLEFDYTTFSDLDISNSFSVEVIESDQYSLVIEIDKSRKNRLQVREEDGCVHIGLENSLFSGSYTHKAVVSMPFIRSIKASGASDITLSGDFVSTNQSSIDLSGTSNLSGALSSKTLTMELSGASKLVLSGETGLCTLDISGASTCNLDDYRAETADIEISGASFLRIKTNSNAKLDVSGASTCEIDIESGELDAEASGASTIRYSGSVDLVSSDTSGASSIQKIKS